LIEIKQPTVQSSIQAGLRTSASANGHTFQPHAVYVELEAALVVRREIPGAFNL
jgi:hypothetical protein